MSLLSGNLSLFMLSLSFLSLSGGIICTGCVWNYMSHQIGYLASAGPRVFVCVHVRACVSIRTVVFTLNESSVSRLNSGVYNISDRQPVHVS